jgi:hypothetical protein
VVRHAILALAIAGMASVAAAQSPLVAPVNPNIPADNYSAGRALVADLGGAARLSPGGFEVTGLDGSHEVLERGEDLLDGVQVWAVGRQEDEERAADADGGAGGMAIDRGSSIPAAVRSRLEPVTALPLLRDGDDRRVCASIVVIQSPLHCSYQAADFDGFGDDIVHAGGNVGLDLVAHDICG